MTQKKLQAEAVKCVKRIMKTAQKLVEIENLYAQEQAQDIKPNSVRNGLTTKGQPR